MKRLVIVLIFFCLSFSSKAQNVYPLTVDELNDRIHKGLDTTFVINFWATWCKPCIKELPFFIQLDKSYNKDKLKVLLVSVDFPSEINNSVIPFIKKMAFEKDMYIITDKNQQDYIDKVDKTWSGAIPATLFIKEGKRQLVEESLTYTELLQHYQNILQ